LIFPGKKHKKGGGSISELFFIILHINSIKFNKKFHLLTTVYDSFFSSDKTKEDGLQFLSLFVIVLYIN